MVQFIIIVGLSPYFPRAIPGIFTVSDNAQGLHLVFSGYIILAKTSLLVKKDSSIFDIPLKR
jgi:hypothetical protein